MSRWELRFECETDYQEAMQSEGRVESGPWGHHYLRNSQAEEGEPKKEKRIARKV